jgi:hypothetical protein
MPYLLFLRVKQKHAPFFEGINELALAFKTGMVSVREANFNCETDSYNFE